MDIFKGQNLIEFSDRFKTDLDCKKYAAIAHETCLDVPFNLHAHQFRHAKASHLLHHGMNIAQLSKLLGHVNLSTTMVYLDITIDMQAKAIISLEDEKTRNTPRIWRKR